MRFIHVFQTTSALSIATALIIGTLHMSSTASPVMASTSEEEEDYNGILVNEPGADTTYAYCAGCHSERIIAQQGLTRDGWVELLDWMIEEQGMGEIDDPDYTEIINYLSDHYGEDRPNFPS